MNSTLYRHYGRFFDYFTPKPILSPGFFAKCLRLNPRILFASLFAAGLIASCEAAPHSYTSHDCKAGGLIARPAAILSTNEVNRYVAAIYRVEGGDKTRFPYGVKSVKCKDRAEAKRVTENSVRNNWRRWQAAGKPVEFVDFMADRWCPVAADPQGNVNWKKNMKAILCQK